jgi:hypothetical protein
MRSRCGSAQASSGMRRVSLPGPRRTSNPMGRRSLGTGARREPRSVSYSPGPRDCPVPAGRGPRGGHRGGHRYVLRWWAKQAQHVALIGGFAESLVLAGGCLLGSCVPVPCRLSGSRGRARATVRACDAARERERMIAPQRGLQTSFWPSSLVRPRTGPSSPSLTCWAASHPQNPKNRRRKTNVAPEEATFDGGWPCAMCPQR